MVPRHSVGGIRGDEDVVAQEGDEVVERGDAIQLSGVDHTHENVADMRPVQGVIIIGVVSVQDARKMPPMITTRQNGGPRSVDFCS